MKNELIKIENKGVSAIELHKFLEVETPYSMWIKRRIHDYGFVDGQDFVTILLESTGGRKQIDHVMSIDMAKEMAMVERTDKGRQVRLYFIKIESSYKNQLLRDSTKETRRDLTDLIQDSGENERMHGHGFSTYTKLIYKTLGIEYTKEKNFRDTLSGDQLKAISAMEKMVESYLRLGYEYGQIKDSLPKIIIDKEKKKELENENQC